MKVRNTRKYDTIRFMGEVFKPGEVKEMDVKPKDLMIGLEEVKEKNVRKKEEVKNTKKEE